VSSDTFASRAGLPDYLQRGVGTFPGHQWGPSLATSGDLTWPPAGTSLGHHRGLSHGHGQRPANAADTRPWCGPREQRLLCGL
ncbi:MAG: hypothetical protein M3O70_23985, partial [Actinomycetota bacterium]|nr:hypothetical protein [Actinomycetota bacterium]